MRAITVLLLLLRRRRRRRCLLLRPRLLLLPKHNQELTEHKRYFIHPFGQLIKLTYFLVQGHLGHVSE
jgi:hypothetical protein